MASTGRVVTRFNRLPRIADELEIRAQRAVEVVAENVADEMRRGLEPHERSGQTAGDVTVDVRRGRKQARAVANGVAAVMLEVGRPAYHPQPATPFGRPAAFAGMRRSQPTIRSLFAGLGR